jgi:hypothetical protein|tara:strand:+ start:917 stop:1105 length:189 start_codon:yes stop_codon:yes gene_type:complete
MDELERAHNFVWEYCPYCGTNLTKVADYPNSIEDHFNSCGIRSDRIADYYDMYHDEDEFLPK